MRIIWGWSGETWEPVTDAPKADHFDKLPYWIRHMWHWVNKDFECECRDKYPLTRPKINKRR